MDVRDIERIAARVASSGRVRTAGKIEFVKDTGPLRRDVRVDGFEWSADSLRNLAKILWAAQRSHSYAMSAFRLFSKMPSSEFSPDGLLGGRGYIQAVKDMRTNMSQAVEFLSAFTDTVHDEINADHWKPVDDAEAQELVADVDEVKANPEEFVEQEYDQETGGETDYDDTQSQNSEEEPVQNPSPDEYNPDFESLEEEEDQGGDDQGFTQTSASKLPDDEEEQKEGRNEGDMLGQSTTVPAGGHYAAAIANLLKSHRKASSSLPGGMTPIPMVTERGPASGNEAGHFNNDDVWASDDPCGEGFSHLSPLTDDEDNLTGYDHPTEGDNTVLKTAARVAARFAEEHGGYSLLPGADNDRNLNYYDRGLSQADVDWMRQNAAPVIPGQHKRQEQPDDSWLWGDARP